MKWNYTTFFLFCFCFSLLSLNSCKFSDAMIEQSYDSDRSIILSGVDSKYVTWSRLNIESPELLPKWKQERKAVEASQALRKKDIALPEGSDYFKVFGMALTGWQTGGLAGILSLITLLGGIIGKRKHERKVRDKVQEEVFIAKGKEFDEIENSHKKKRKKKA